ncbi:SBBP repeat-containing protein [Methanobrevibacter sp.]
MNKKMILIILVIFSTICLISSVSAADSDVLSVSDENIETAQGVEIGDDVIAQSENDDAMGDETEKSIESATSQELLTEGESSSNNTIIQNYGTYIGGNGNDKGKGVYTDMDGNIYLAMETDSNDLVTTENAYQNAPAGGKDLYVSKYTSTGDLIYATYIGGSATEMQKDLKVDSQGNVYVIGFTNSVNFPTTENAFQKEVNGSQDAFLTVLNPTGTALLYSTYLGGSVVDRAWALAIDDKGSAYIQGITNSINFPVTADAFQKDKDGVNWTLGDPDDIDYQNSFDLFLSKFDINSGELKYSTFFGAKGSDSTYGSVAVDENEVIYFAGTTTSIDFPVTENAYRDVRDAGADSFLAALDIKNNELVFSSYIGGNDTDDGEAIVLSPNGFLYYVGDTWSENFPTTKRAFQTKFAGVGESISGGDMFIMKIDTSNWELVYATLLGGKFDEGVRALAVDEDENAWVVGMSQSTDYPVTDDAYQITKNGPAYISYAESTDYDYPTHDIVLSKISADGSELLYSTFYGGKSGEFAMGIVFVNGGFALQLRTCSDDLFVSDNTTKGQDQFNGSLLGNDPVYDFDSYLAIFENPTIIEIGDISTKLGKTINLTATLTDSMGSTPIANKTVEFFINNELAGTAITDENGVAAYVYTPSKTGTDTYTVSFNETIGHAAAIATANIAVAYYDIPTVEVNPSSAVNLVFGTYIGGNGNDKGKGVYIDKEGNIYLAMETDSTDLITTENAYQKAPAGGKDLYVSKYSADGELIYATFIGGSATEMQKDLKVDSQGNVYVIGFGNSKDMPVTENAFQKELNGSQDGFLVVLNPDGTDLVYSTYLGGSVVDRAWALAIDDNGTAYIQGITNSIDFPVTPDAYQKDKDGVNWSMGDPDDIDYQNSFDLFLSKININTGELQYSTFFGAKGSDSTYGSVAVDKNEVIYFAGSTTSIDFPVTENAYRDVRDAGSDSFLAALDIRNSKLIFSSYIGGNNTDDGEAIVLSPNGFLYYVGDTWSENFPTTENAFQKTFAGVGESISGGDMFIMKIDTSNWELVYATLLGGEFDEGVRALAVDEDENAWVVGMSQSDNYPVTEDAYQTERNGLPYISYAQSTDYDYPTHDIVLSKISADGSELLYSTYFGGKSGEFAMGIVFVNGGFALQLRTCSDDLYVSDNTSKGQDQFYGSLLGNDPVYDFDSYLVIFENPTVITTERIITNIGQAVNITANVKESMGNLALANKTVDFYVDNVYIGSATTDENGTAIISYSPEKAGVLDYNAVFNETIGHANANVSNIIAISGTNALKETIITVEPAFSRVSTDFHAGERGQMFYATLTDIDGNPLANKTVQIAINGPIYNVTTDEQGRAGLQINVANANVYTYALSFTGDNEYKASPLASTKLTVTKKSTSISASAKTFKAKAKKVISVTLKTVKNKDGKTYLKKGKKLTLKINGKTYTAKTNAKGVAKFTIKLTKKGKYTADIKFAGDNSYKNSSKKIKVTIK